MDAFRVTVRVDGSVHEIVVAGELDVSAAPAIRSLVDASAEAGATEVRFDLRDVTFCDSTGVHLLLHAYRIGVRVVVVPSSAVLRVLQITGADDFVIIEDP